MARHATASEPAANTSRRRQTIHAACASRQNGVKAAAGSTSRASIAAPPIVGCADDASDKATREQAKNASTKSHREAPFRPDCAITPGTQFGRPPSPAMRSIPDYDSSNASKDRSAGSNRLLNVCAGRSYRAPIYYDFDAAVYARQTAHIIHRCHFPLRLISSGESAYLIKITFV